MNARSHQGPRGLYFCQLHLFQSHKPCWRFNISPSVTLIFTSVVIALTIPFFLSHNCFYCVSICLAVASPPTARWVQGKPSTPPPSSSLLDIFLPCLPAPSSWVSHSQSQQPSYPFIPSHLCVFTLNSLSPRHPLQSIHFLHLVIASLTKPLTVPPEQNSKVLLRHKWLQRAHQSSKSLLMKFRCPAFPSDLLVTRL